MMLRPLAVKVLLGACVALTAHAAYCAPPRNETEMLERLKRLMDVDRCSQVDFHLAQNLRDEFGGDVGISQFVAADGKPVSGYKLSNSGFDDPGKAPDSLTLWAVFRSDDVRDFELRIRWNAGTGPEFSKIEEIFTPQLKGQYARRIAELGADTLRLQWKRQLLKLEIDAETQKVKQLALVPVLCGRC